MLWPSQEKFSAPTHQTGIGLLSGLLTGLATGLLDGVIACLRTPPPNRDAPFWCWTLFSCVGIFLPAAFVLGIALELVLRCSVVQTVRKELGSSTPKTWFDHNVLSVLQCALGITCILAVLHTFTTLIEHAHYRREQQTKTLLVSTWPALAAVVFALTASSSCAVKRTLSRLTALSPGGVMVLAAPILAHHSARFVSASVAVFGPRNVAAMASALSFVLCAVLLSLALVTIQKHLLTRLLLGLLVVALVSSGVCASSIHTRQTAFSAVLLHTILAHRLLRPLQQIVDQDRDGYGRFFGGGDCDDHNPHVHPAAYDIPRNGVDENCSGEDSLGVLRGGHGEFVPVHGSLALRHPSFAIITIDTLRADHVGVYGYPRATTPRIDAFARTAARFSRAYAAAPQSIRSLSALFTGKSPAEICWGRHPQYPALAPSNTTLAELLRDNGYESAAFLDSSYFGSFPHFFQGWGFVAQSPDFKGNPATTVQNALAWLQRVSTTQHPFFLWVHLVGPHAPYEDRSSPRDFGHTMIDRYDEEIAAVDETLAPLLATLLHPSAPPTIVVVASDHGEAFGEHGRYFHAQDAHEVALRVPLLLWGPGVVPGVREELVGLFDLFPTALNYAGLAPPTALSSRSLVALLQAPGTSTTSPWRTSLRADVAIGSSPPTALALVDGHWKLLHDVTHGSWELYNLAVDPTEQHNLVDQEPLRMGILRSQLLDRSEAEASCGATL